MKKKVFQATIWPFAKPFNPPFFWKVNFQKNGFVTILIMAISCAAFLSQAKGQVQNLAAPAYEKSSIYLKLRDTSDMRLLAHPALIHILNAYQMDHFRQPFVIFNTKRFDRTYQINFAPSADLLTVINEVSSLGEVEYAERLPLVSLDNTIPTDPNEAYYWP